MPSPTTDRLTDQECVAMLSRSTLAAVGDLVAEVLLPQRCIVCDRFGAALHLDCIETLPAAAPPRCDVCWAPVRKDARRCARCAEHAPAYAHLRTPFRFTARGAGDEVPRCDEADRAACRRGRPCRAAALADRRGSAGAATSCSRTQTRVQPGGERRLRGVFEVVGEAPERVLIDDDVTTTGSTFDEVAGVLIRAGASTVYALALGRED